MNAFELHGLHLFGPENRHKFNKDLVYSVFEFLDHVKGGQFTQQLKLTKFRNEKYFNDFFENPFPKGDQMLVYSEQPETNTTQKYTIILGTLDDIPQHTTIFLGDPDDHDDHDDHDYEIRKNTYKALSFLFRDAVRLTGVGKKMPDIRDMKMQITSESNPLFVIRIPYESHYYPNNKIFMIESFGPKQSKRAKSFRKLGMHRAFDELKALPPGTYNSKSAPSWVGQYYRSAKKRFDSRISRKNKPKLKSNT
jgi:hypothetical protein